MKRRHRCSFALATSIILAGACGLLTSLAGSIVASAEPIETGPREPNLMPGQVIDGWTGLPIPCRCRFQGETYRLGDIVCMSTHVGVVMTRCELFLNNTSWMPTREPCTISEARPAQFASLNGDFHLPGQQRPMCRAN